MQQAAGLKILEIYAEIAGDEKGGNFANFC